MNPQNLPTVDIRPAYLRKADDFQTNDAHFIRHAAVHLIITPIFLTMMVIFLELLLYPFGADGRPVARIEVWRVIIVVGVFLGLTTLVAFNLTSPQQWRLKGRTMALSWGTCLLITLVLIGFTLYDLCVNVFWGRDGSLWKSHFEYVIYGAPRFQILMLGYIFFTVLVVKKTPRFWSYAIPLVCVAIVLWGVNPLFNIPFYGADYSAEGGARWLSLFFFLITFLISVIGYLPYLFSTKIERTSLKRELLDYLIHPASLLVSDIRASFLSLTRRGRHDWLISRASTTLTPQRWPNRWWNSTFVRFLRNQQRVFVVLFTLFIGGVVAPAIVYFLVRGDNPNPNPSLDKLKSNELLGAASELSNVWQVSPIDLLIVGLISTTIAIGVLALWYATRNRERYMISEFTVMGVTGDPHLRGLADGLRRALVKELQQTAVTLKRRQIENLSFSNDDSNAFFISSGLDQEFLERLEDVGTLDVPNVSGVNLGRVWEMYARSIARMLAGGNVSRNENGDIIINVNLRYQRRPPVYVRTLIELRPSDETLDEVQVQRAAREIALKLIIELGQVPGIGQSWHTLDELLRGIDAANHQNWWKAISHYYDALNTQSHDTQDDKHSLIYFHLGSALVFQGRWDLGRNMLQKADEYGPPTPEIAYMMAFTQVYTYWEQLDKTTMVFDQIRAYCRKSIDLRPDAPEAYHLLAQAYYQRARMLDKKGRGQKDRSAKKQDNPYGDFLESSRLYRQALRLYDRQIDKLRGQKVLSERVLRTLTQQRMTTSHQLGDALRSLGMYFEAEQYYLDMDAVFPNNLRNVADLLKTYVLSKSWQKAQEYFYRSAFASNMTRWDADVLVHPAWGIMGGSVDWVQLTNEKQKESLQIESYGYLDYALYMRPRYENSWRQSNWDSVFNLKKGAKSHTPDDYLDMFGEEFSDLSPKYFSPDDRLADIGWFHFILRERWRETQLFKVARLSQSAGDFGPTGLFIGFLWQQLASPELRIEVRHKLLAYRLPEVGRLQARFIDITHRIMALEMEVANKNVREGGLRLTFKYIHFAQELYEELFHPFFEIIDITYKDPSPKRWITRTGRLILDLYLRVAMLTARLLAQAEMYPLLVEMSGQIVEQLESFTQDWRGAYPFTEGQKDRDIGRDEHFTLIPFTFRYQRATFHAWNAYGLLMQHEHQISRVSLTAEHDIQRDVTLAKERILTVLKALVQAHPLALFVNAKLHAYDKRYSEAIREMESLLDIIEPFEPKRDLGASISENKDSTPSSFQDNDRMLLYHWERLTGRQQFHHIVNPVLIRVEMAKYAMKMDDQHLSLTHLSEAVRFSPFNDTHLDIFIELAGQFSSMDRYPDAQAILHATKQPRSRLEGISLSPTKRAAPKVMEAIVSTRRMMHARALRFTQQIAKEYQLVLERDIVEMVRHVYKVDEDAGFVVEFSQLTNLFLERTAKNNPQDLNDLINKVGKITGLGKLDSLDPKLTDLVDVLEAFQNKEIEHYSLNSNFGNLFRSFQPSGRAGITTVSEAFSHFAKLACYAHNRKEMGKLLNIHTNSAFWRAKFAQIAVFYCEQASTTLLHIADLCNALAYNRASTTIGDEAFAKTDALMALIIVSYLRSVSDSDPEHSQHSGVGRHLVQYDELRERLAQYCDTYGWVNFMSAMPSSIQQRLIREAEGNTASPVLRRLQNMLDNPSKDEHNKTLYAIREGLTKAIHGFEQGIHYDPIRSIIHYHLACAYLQSAEIMLRGGSGQHEALTVMVASHLDSAANALEVARRTDTHGRLSERLKQQSQRYRQLKRQIGLTDV